MSRPIFLLFDLGRNHINILVHTAAMTHHRSTSLLAMFGTALLFLLAAAPSQCDGASVVAGRRMGPVGRNRHLKQNGMTPPAVATRQKRKKPPAVAVPEVANASFEGNMGKVRSDWAGVSPAAAADLPGEKAGGYEVSTTESRSGGQSIKVIDGGAHQIVKMTGAGPTVGPGTMITIGGYSKAKNTGSGLWNDYSIYADVTYTDGTTLLGEAARFPGGTTYGDTWAYEATSFIVPNGKYVDFIDLHVLYRNDPTENGVAYFDDVFVKVDMPMLSNPSFEGGNLRASGWNSYMGGYTISTDESHTGSQSIAVKSGGALQRIYPDPAEVKSGSKLKFSGYAKSVGVAPIHNGPAVMSVYVDVKFMDGSWLYGQEAEFAGGVTEGWEYAENTILLLKDVEAIHLYAVYYGDDSSGEDGVAYFDDFDLVIT